MAVLFFWEEATLAPEQLQPGIRYNSGNNPEIPKMTFNLANKSQDEMERLYVDKEAAGVAFKERYNQPVIAEQIAATQPAHLQDYFFERLKVHRAYSKTLGRIEPQAADKK